MDIDPHTSKFLLRFHRADETCMIGENMNTVLFKENICRRTITSLNHKEQIIHKE
jgi:hypothetical protein